MNNITKLNQMPFCFLKYLQPTHYFRLFNNEGISVYPIVQVLPKSIISQLTIDSGYTSKLATDYDLSYQAVQAGYIGSEKNYTHFESLSVHDNYYFIRKQFHPFWVFYVLVMRMLTLHYPIREFRAWLTTSSIGRTRASSIVHPLWASYKSELIAQQPLVSVVIPTLNRYDYLKDVLNDFEKQDYSHFEIIVVDQSDLFRPEFYEKFDLSIRVVYQKEKALWLARNSAIKEAKGLFIALSEDDVRIKPDWIQSHLKCLDFFEAQVSAGVFYPQGESIPKERSFFALASQFATGNAMLYKSVFEQVGLFDCQFEKQRMGDGEFGLRLYLAGIRSISNPFASCIDLKATMGGLREMGSWDAFRTKKWFSPRPIPSVLYFYRKYFGNKSTKWSLLRTVPLSIMPYQFKRNKVMMLLGVVAFLLMLPVVFFQVFKSWRLSSKKLNEGPLIEQLILKSAK